MNYELLNTGGILIIDKPPDWTSHDVIAKLRGVLRVKRIGHGGTLDPMATGVLPVFIGRATRAVQFCENAEKEYIAALRPGLETDTQDITGTVLSEKPHNVTLGELSDVLELFKGAQQQIPPMYSAVKIGGKKLYELARRGKTIDRPARNIFISQLEIIGCENGGFILRVVCSKGTYIRTLCHDIGQKLGCGAVMSSLKRTRAGAFTLADSHSLQSVIDAAERGDVLQLIRPVDSLFTDFSAVTLNEQDTARCKNGVQLKLNLTASGRYRVYGADGAFLMLGEFSDGVLKSVKNFYYYSGIERSHF